jgi:hypothetical protein
MDIVINLKDRRKNTLSNIMKKLDALGAEIDQLNVKLNLICALQCRAHQNDSDSEDSLDEDSD